MSAELYNHLAKGLECNASELKALLTEGNTDKSYAKNYAENEVYKAEYDTAENIPEEVAEGALAYEENDLTKRLENKLRKLEVLLTEGDTYESKTESKTEYEVYCSENEAAEYAPKEIAEFSHCVVLLEFFDYTVILS